MGHEEKKKFPRVKHYSQTMCLPEISNSNTWVQENDTKG